MDDLIAFLRARLDEDQAAIRTWAAACWHLEACEDTGGYLERFDEERMLAEVGAKRKLLDEHQPVAVTYWHVPMCATCIDPAADPIDDPLGSGGPWTPNAEYPCRTVRLLAAPYADHDGYREEWRP